jgi:hypothetical protein
MVNRLSIKEIIRLFGGEVGEDQDGNPFIIVDNKETRPNPLADVEDMGDED